MLPRARVTRLAIAIALLAVPSAARAYCRRSLCDGQVGTRCLPARAGDCGIPARWPSGCLTYAISAHEPAALGVDGVRAVMATAFEAWMAADCGHGTHPAFRVTQDGVVASTTHAYARGGENHNLVVVHDGPWPHGDGVGQLALTSLSYGARAAAIYDGDIEFNWHELQGMELPPIALHEAGHFLGLAHSDDPASVMNEDVDGGAATKRVLSDDDVRAICASFPPATPAPSCEVTPAEDVRGPASARRWPCAVLLGATLALLAAALGWRRSRS